MLRVKNMLECEVCRRIKLERNGNQRIVDERAEYKRIDEIVTSAATNAADAAQKIGHIFVAAGAHLVVAIVVVAIVVVVVLGFVATHKTAKRGKRKIAELHTRIVADAWLEAVVARERPVGALVVKIERR